MTGFAERPLLRPAPPTSGPDSPEPLPSVTSSPWDIIGSDEGDPVVPLSGQATATGLDHPPVRLVYVVVSRFHRTPAVSLDVEPLELEAALRQLVPEWHPPRPARVRSPGPSRPPSDSRASWLDGLLRTLDDEPVEDGVVHPGEAILERELAGSGRDRALSQLEELLEMPRSASDGAAILRLLGRLPPVGSATWREARIRGALRSPDIEMRDAALQTAESWATPELVPVLQAHSEPVGWLARYRDAILRSMAEAPESDGGVVRAPRT